MRNRSSLTLPLDYWSLGLEAASVIGMRIPRLMAGDASALAEAQLMVSEKIETAARLQWKLMTGGFGSSGPAVMNGSIDHYRKAVRRNQRRLSKSRRSAQGAI